MKVCIFCKVNLKKGSTKAKEHVLRKSWLETLGLSKNPIYQDLFSAEKGVIGSRAQVADSVLAGEICQKCNGGWMDKLDHSVEDIILTFSESPIERSHLTREKIFQIARYLLKTACVFVSTDHPSRRHIPQEIYARAPDPDYLPSGFTAFCARVINPLTPVAVASLDMWVSPLDQFAELTSASRFKFGVQYNQLILGCCYFSAPNPHYSGIPNFHTPLALKGATYTQRESAGLIALPAGIQPTELNITLFKIGVELRQE